MASGKPSKPQCNIILIGKLGSGKSSTVNHLFKCKGLLNISAQVDKSCSATKETKEYIIESDDCLVSIIDTPGYDDTRGGLQQDACNLYSIEKFLHENPDKSPNLIFILISANDNRFIGETSKFKQTLQCFELLENVQFNQSNVVAIITHCCSMRPDHMRANDEWRQNIEEMRGKIQVIILDTLGIVCPVVIIENGYEREKLERSGDFTILPTGSLQPLNLFLECSRLIDRVHKPDGARYAFYKIFRAKDADVWQLQDGIVVRATDATEFPSELNDRERDLYYAIQKLSLRNKDDSSGIHSLCLTESDATNKIKFAKIESIIAQYGNNQALTLGMIEYFLNRKISDEERDFIAKNYSKIEDRRVYLNDKSLVENGYDIFTDTFGEKIFTEDWREFQFGLCYPSNFKLCKSDFFDSVVFYDYHNRENNKKQKINLHLKKKHVEMTVNENQFQLDGRQFCGDVMNLDDFKSHDVDNKSLFLELRVIKLSRQNVRKENLCKAFVKDIGNLPKVDISKNFLPEQYRKFFKKYGTFYVNKFYCGSVKPLQTYGDGSNVREIVDDLENKWMMEAIRDPQCLTEELELRSICDVVEIVDTEKGEAMRKAFELFMGADCRILEIPEKSIRTRVGATESAFKFWNFLKKIGINLFSN